MLGPVSCREDTQFIDGELNFGYWAFVKVQNVRETGFIKVTLTLKTSEGEWSNADEFAMCAYESRIAYHFFKEPTHKAVNPVCLAAVTPTLTPDDLLKNALDSTH